MNQWKRAWVLSALLFFLRAAPAQPVDAGVAAVVPPLVTTAAIQSMPAAAVSNTPLVRIQGVVTLSHDRLRNFFVEDETGGIYCNVAAIGRLPVVGQRVEAVGVVRRGAYLPIIELRSVKDLGPGELPAARAARNEDLWAGKFDGDFVRVSGQIIEPHYESNPTAHWVLPVLMDGRELNLVLSSSQFTQAEATNLSGAFITAQGVCGPTVNAQGQVIVINISVARRDWLTVLTNSDEMARTMARTPLAELIDAKHFVRPKFVRTTGTICMVAPDAWFIAAPSGGIRVSGSLGPNIGVGHQVEICGITGGYQPERRVQLTQLLSSRPGSVPAAVAVEAGALFDFANMGRRLTVKGEFLHRIPRSPGDSLFVRQGGRTFEARFAHDTPDQVTELRAGSEIRLSGVLWYFDRTDREAPIQPRLIIDQPGDFAVLTAPPWPMHITLGIVSSLAGALGLGLLALMVAHRRLKMFSWRIEQTDAELRVLNTELEGRIRERTAELEHANKDLSREVTERINAQYALAEREAHLRTLVESVDAVVWECDLATSRFTYVSPKAVQFGYPMEAWLKPGFWQEHIHPDDRDAAVEFCATQTEKGAPHEFQYRFATASGDYIWVDDKVTVHVLPDGSKMLRGVLIDITERRERDAALRESEERFARAFHGSPASVAITSFPEGVIIDVNNRLMELSGYKREELIGRTSTELEAWANPDERRQVIARLLRGETVRNMEIVVLDKERRHLTMLSSFERIVLGGKPCMLSINLDITERKAAETALRESEERFAKAFQASPVITVITRLADGRYVDVNEQFTRVLGLTREETLGRTALELGIWADPRKRQDILEALENGREIRDWECEFRAKNGAMLNMLLSLERINVRGEPCLLGINHDITARKLAERLRDEQNAVLEMIAQGAPLGPTLDRLVLALEFQSEGMRCSILLCDKDSQHLLHGAAPSLPEDYNRAIHRLAIGPDIGSCGSAAYSKEQVIVEDVEHDSRWSAFLDLARGADIRACWSTPIFDSHQHLLGTFAMYYSEPRRPDARAQRLLATAAHTAAICIKNAADDAALRETARTLHHQNELLQFMGRLAQVGAWSLDIGTRTLDWTQQTYAIHEVDPSTKPDVTTAINFYAPEARPVITAAVEAGLKNGTPWDLELPLITAKGRRIWVRAQGQLEMENGRAVRLSGAFQDITSRRLTEQALRTSEERFQLAMRGANDGLWDWDLVTNSCYYSPRWKSMLGYGDDELPAHLDTWKRFSDPDDLNRVLDEVQSVLKGTNETFQSEFRMRHKDGHWVNILSRAFLVRDAQGVPARLVGTHLDITERKRAEESHRQLEAQLRQAQKMEAIGTLAGGVAHDFNNLLGVIIGCAELARMDCASNLDAIENLNDLLKASHRAKDLVRQILTFSRQQPQERHVIPLQPVVEESIRLMRAALPASVQLVAHLDEPAPSVMADAGLMQQVIMNLVTNAAQAIGSRAGRIDVSLETIPSEEVLRKHQPALQSGPHVRLQIRDDGCGMDTSVSERIFEPFFTTKGPGQGTGLGLSVVHGIVRSHEGFITVESAPGAGSTFSVYLPVARTTQGTRLTADAANHHSKGSERILLVDDEPALLKVSERLLRTAGYDVTICDNATEALDIFRQSPSAFSAVITDLAMPGRTGDTLARELLAIRPGTPILVCTGNAAKFTREDALQLGFRDILHKPVELDQICRALRQAIDSPAPLRQP